MARARRRGSSPQEAIEDSQEVVAQPLEFDQPLTWRTGKPIPVSELLRRLKELFEELESIEQDNADRETLVPKAQELAHTQLLDHRDQGIKAYVMACIVEMFRLLAPDAPYKASQLKQIFGFFINTIVPALADPSDPYSQLHISVLISLSKVKSIVILIDIPGSDDLIVTLFTNCFDVMSGGAKGGNGERLPKNLEHHMTAMLCTLIADLPSLPNGVIEIILAQFLRADPNAVLSNPKKGNIQLSEELPEPSAAYSMARAICNTCADKIVHANAHYFSSVLVDATQAIEDGSSSKAKGRKRTHNESDEDDDERGLLTPPAEEDLMQAEKAHRLLRELWRAAPDITRNVIPQMEAELRTENVRLREMAVQTVGDMVAGIGAAGPPPPIVQDPAAYPSPSLEPDEGLPQQRNMLLNASAPTAFSTSYPAAYQGLLDRHKDKAWQVRSAFATAAGRIILTSAGGKGLNSNQQAELLQHLSDLLNDLNERVRLAAVQIVSTFDYHTVVGKVGSNGGVSVPNSLLHSLADRVKDRTPSVRNAAIDYLARLWGVASGAIGENEEKARDLLGPVTSKILDAMYLNKPDVNALIQRVLFDYLLPISYPPKTRTEASTSSQRLQDSQTSADGNYDADAMRAKRILVFVRDLEEDRARRIFFLLQQRQPEIAKYLEAFLKACEASQDKVSEANGPDSRKKLASLIDFLSKTFTPDPEISAEHLRKFVKAKDRRSHQLIRFCYMPESDYRKVVLATKELKKRMTDAFGGQVAPAETVLSLVYQAAILIYNKSHVPAIVEISRTDAGGLGQTAHLLLKDISDKAPEIFKIHVKELCDTLKNQSPDNGTNPDAGMVDTLKACAGFARRFPGEMPRDRGFYKALVAFAASGYPPKAAKHAVTVIISSADKKELYIKEIEKLCINGFEYGKDGCLAKLAAMSQLRLLANEETNDLSEKMMAIAIDDVLTQIRTAPQANDPDWASELDEDITAKLLALRILVNGLRGMNTEDGGDDRDEQVKTAAVPIYRLLNTLIAREGELGQDEGTPKHHRAQLRLAAATHILKLSCNRTFDNMLTAADFNGLSRIAQDPTPEVRAGFLTALKRYLTANSLPSRFYALIYLYAFEPDKEIKEAAIGWARARAAMHARAQSSVIETTFARFLSLLAHHPDFSASDPDDLQDFVEYIVFYLRNAASETNLPMVYYIAQRLKSVQDGINPDKSDNLYVMSDLAEAVIRQYQEIQEWPLQLYSGKIGLPGGIFARLPSHKAAQEIAETNYLPEGFASRLESIVKTLMRTKKRKSEISTPQESKRARLSIGKSAGRNTQVRKHETNAIPRRTKVPKKPRDDQGIPSSERRKSSRVSRNANYAEVDEDDDDDELERWQESEDGAEHEEEEEAVDSRSSSPAEDASKSPEPTPKPIAKAAPRKVVQSKKLPVQRSSRTRTTRSAASNKLDEELLDASND